MAASTAVATRGLTLKRGNTASPVGYTEVGEILGWSKSGPEQEMIDVTHLKSDNEYREFIGGMINGGTHTFEMNWIPDNVQQVLLQTDIDAHTKRSWQVVINNPTTATLTFSAYVQSFSASGDLSSQLTGTLVLQQSGWFGLQIF